MALPHLPDRGDEPVFELGQRFEDGDATISTAAKEAAASYAQSFASAEDALSRLVKDLGGLLGSARSWFDERFGRHDH